MFENDPLLTSGRNLEQLAQENEMYQQKLQALQQFPKTQPVQHTATPVWDEIDRIVSSLNDQERGILSNNKEYYDNSMAIQEMVNAELLLLVKGRIEASAEGKAILEQQLSFVRRTSKTAKEETARRDALFREYVTEHSDMTWQEFIDWKNGNLNLNQKMMEAKKSITEIKDKMADSLLLWVDDRIDTLVEANPKLKVASVYLKGVQKTISPKKETT